MFRLQSLGSLPSTLAPSSSPPRVKSHALAKPRRMETGWGRGASWEYHRLPSPRCYIPSPDSCPAILPLHSARVPRPLSASCVAAAASYITPTWVAHTHNSAGRCQTKSHSPETFTQQPGRYHPQKKLGVACHRSSTALRFAMQLLTWQDLHEGLCHPRIPVVPTVPLRSPPSDHWLKKQLVHTEHVWKYFMCWQTYPKKTDLVHSFRPNLHFNPMHAFRELHSTSFQTCPIFLRVLPAPNISQQPPKARQLAMATGDHRPAGHSWGRIKPQGKWRKVQLKS